MDGYINSFESLGTVDGPGVRCVIFMQGCPLRCVYCHNPDTWKTHAGKKISPAELIDKILRYKSYIKQGGVTVSGGEALLQAEFVRELFELCHEHGIHTALDTSGCLLSPEIDKLLDTTDLCLLDLKMTTERDYVEYTKQTLSSALLFLDKLQEKKIPTWIRHVIVPNLNNNLENIARLNALISPYNVIEKVELLPFRKLCLEKYDNLGIGFPLRDTPEADTNDIKLLQEKIILPGKG